MAVKWYEEGTSLSNVPKVIIWACGKSMQLLFSPPLICALSSMLRPEGLDGGSKQGLGAEGAGGCCLICSLPLRAHVELGGGERGAVQRELLTQGFK